MKYKTISGYGNLITEEILDTVYTGRAGGQSPVDFGLEPGINLRSEIEYAWSRIRIDWNHFTIRARTISPVDPYGTSLARKWTADLLGVLGFELTVSEKSLIGDNERSYPISHIAGNLDGLPIHIAGFRSPAQAGETARSVNTLDIRSGAGRSRFSPHGLMQEYLNAGRHLYGMIANGFRLRLLRDSGRLISLCYLEFDLEQMLDEDLFGEFTLLYRLLHASRFPRNVDESNRCLLEKYYHDSIESGNRIRDGLSLAVKESLLILGNGFLNHPANQGLRQSLITRQHSPMDFYRRLLYLIYRMLFLMVAEERNLVFDPDNDSEENRHQREIYRQYYSLARLRRFSRNESLHQQEFHDLWFGLCRTFQLFSPNGPGTKLGLYPLGGELFDDQVVMYGEEDRISNRDLLDSIRHLNEFRDENHNLVTINYRALDVEELGSVYEGLLELHPSIELHELDNSSGYEFRFYCGMERKTTGSYYTRPELVNELIKSALIPVIEERLKRYPDRRDQQAEELLKLKVCDPAAGSGHILLAAARTIGWYLARCRSGEDNPAPEIYRSCLQEVICHCIYGVDLNPDAVELCKLSLWIESHRGGKPLPYLNHKIRNGNSLVGVSDLDSLHHGIPDEAYSPVSRDDKMVCTRIRKVNVGYRLTKTKQYPLFIESDPLVLPHEIPDAYQTMLDIPQDDIRSVTLTRTEFESIRKDQSWRRYWTACNLWIAPFFYSYTRENETMIPDSERLECYLTDPERIDRSMVEKVDRMAAHYRYFHWPLEFPDVFRQGGFDVVLGNPPWERIKLQQQEFFSARNPKIAGAGNATIRNVMIDDLSRTDPFLWQSYQHALHDAECSAKFLRAGGRFPLTAIGDINTYSVFAELFSTLVNSAGRIGLVVPTGIATDDGNKKFFGSMVESNRLISLFDFENREKIFKDVDSRQKFCLLTLAGRDMGQAKPRFAFFLTRVEHLQDERRFFPLTRDDFLLMNPNTHTCPIFRTRMDAELTTRIYRRFPVMVNEHSGSNPWGISFMRMFDMSNDSKWFKTRADLESAGYRLIGNRMVKPIENRTEEEEPSRSGKNSPVWLPLYEAKMIWHYDHRYGTYSGVTDRKSTHIPTPELSQYQDPAFRIMPWYWVEESRVKARCDRRWLIGFRDIARSTDERTVIVSVLPHSAVNHKLPIIDSCQSIIKKICLIGLISCIPFDFFVRQKIGGTSVTYFYFKQFIGMQPDIFTSQIEKIIIPNFMELVYTDWDIKAFADDLWREADQELRAAIRNQWDSNQAATGGHGWIQSEWSDEPTDPGQPGYDGCPLPPFKWDELRRAELKASLDAVYAKLYGLSTDELRYILDPQELLGDNFPGETFRVLKEKEIRMYGEYRTRRLILDAWDKLEHEF